MKVVRLSWKDYETGNGTFSSSYLVAKQQEIASLRSAGMRVILDLGLQDTPQWIHQYSDSYLVNQYGEQWMRTTDPNQPIDESDANLVFNSQLRSVAANYVSQAVHALGASAAAVRIGGGRDNELGFPVSSTSAHKNTYWAYDTGAQAQDPVPGWKPGAPSPHGEAGRFLSWYLSSITNFEQWQISTVRSAFAGPIIVLYPSWGLRPGQVQQAVADNLGDASSAEINGEVQRAHDFSSEVSAIRDPNVWVETTWLDARYGSDSSANPDDWSPVHYLASLASANSLRPEVWGENTGQGSAGDMTFSAQQAQRFGLAAVVWFRESELLSGSYATLSDLKTTIATYH